MTRSLASFVMVFDASGRVLASSAALNGAPPSLPDGVLTYVQAHGEDRFTWQPTPGVRSAAVATRFQGQRSGFVVAGRSLREVEDRKERLKTDIAFLGSAALGIALVAATLLALTARPKPR